MSLAGSFGPTTSAAAANSTEERGDTDSGIESSRITAVNSGLPPANQVVVAAVHKCPYKIPTCKGCVGHHGATTQDRNVENFVVSNTVASVRPEQQRVIDEFRPQYQQRQYQQHRHHSQQDAREKFYRLNGKDDKPSSTTGAAAAAAAASVAVAVGVERPPHQVWNDIRTSFVAWNFNIGVINAAKASGFLKSWDFTRSVAVVGAADALSTLNIGLNARDYRLLGEGRKRYYLTITALRDEMEKPGAVLSDNVLNSVFTVCHLEVYTIISSPDSLGWQTHVAGVQLIFRKRGFNGFKTPPAQALLQNCRHLILGDAVLRRKRTFLGDPRWIAAASQMPNTAIELMNIAVRVPEALEMTDLACAEATKKKQTARAARLTVDTLALLVKIQDELQKWLLKYYKQWTTSPYHITNASTFPTHVERCGDFLNVFPKALVFPTFVSATTHEYYWVVLYLIRHAIADVAKLCRQRGEQLLYPGEANEDKKLDAAVLECVNNLCQSVAFLSKPEHKSFGIMSSNLALHFVQAWFRRQGEQDKIEWCQRIRHALLRQGDFKVPLRLEKPLFIWWMLPENSVPTRPNQTLTAADDIGKNAPVSAASASVATSRRTQGPGRKVAIARQLRPLQPDGGAGTRREAASSQAANPVVVRRQERNIQKLARKSKADG